MEFFILYPLLFVVFLLPSNLHMSDGLKVVQTKLQLLLILYKVRRTSNIVLSMCQTLFETSDTCYT